MQKRIIVCLLASVAVFLRGDGDFFVNNYQAVPAAGKSELNYSSAVYQGAFQDGINNTSPDYQTAGASTFLDPNNIPAPEPVLNDGEISGIAVGGAAALAGITGGGALIARKWSRSINKRIEEKKARKQPAQQIPQQAQLVSGAVAASSSAATPSVSLRFGSKPVTSGAAPSRSTVPVDPYAMRPDGSGLAVTSRSSVLSSPHAGGVSRVGGNDASSTPVMHHAVTHQVAPPPPGSRVPGPITRPTVPPLRMDVVVGKKDSPRAASPASTRSGSSRLRRSVSSQSF